MGKKGPVIPASELQHGKDKKTVFIRGIPFAMGEKELEALFSEVGPVKQCFLVRTKGQEKHRGFGFVQFALPEDAERAAGSLNGMQVDGRKLLVELADKRAPMEERKKKRKHEGEPDAAAEPVPEADEVQEKEEGKEEEEKVKVEEEPPKKLWATEKRKAQAAAAPPPKRQAQAAAAPPPKRQAQAAAAPPPKGKNEAKHKLLQAVALGNFLVQPSKGNASEAPGLLPIDCLPRAKLAALEYARTLGKVVEVIDPAPPDLVSKSHLFADGCDTKTQDGVVVVYYASVKEAMEVVAGLHRKWLTLARDPLDGKKGKKGGGGKEEASIPASSRFDLWARQLTGEGALVKKWRVIVRNLPFKVTEGMVREALEPKAGFVWELTLPRGPDGKVKGFAFASFTCQAHAQKAIETVNGTKIGGRMVAVDWAVEKDTFESSKSQPVSTSDAKKGKMSEMDEEEEEEEEEEGYGDEDEDKEIVEVNDNERVMLKSVIDQVLAGEEVEEEEKELGRHAKEASKSSSVKDKEVNKGKKVKATTPPSKDPKAQEDDGDLKPKEKKPRSNSELQEKKVPDYLSKTVFVRGLPLDATSIELQARMETFGLVHMCRVVMDKASGKPKGTAFVEYKQAADAVKATQACERGRKSLGPGVSLKGKLIDLDLAVDPDAARQLAQSKGVGSAGGLPKDKRNLYLSKEGLIEEGTKAWESLSDSDKQKRKRAAEEMKQKLKSPNFMLSSTRLSLRNLPYELDEAKLKALAIAAVKQRATKETPRIVQVKVLRELEGRMGEDGKPRSKGMGFVEFADHDHAMTALRQLNNNPGLFGASRRPIVEFSVENVKVLQKLEAIKVKKEALKQKQKAGEEAKEGSKKRQRDDGEEAGEGEGQEIKRVKPEPNPEDEGKSKTQLKREKLLKSREKQKLRRQAEKDERLKHKAEGTSFVPRKDLRARAEREKPVASRQESRRDQKIQPKQSSTEPARPSRRQQQRGEEMKLEALAKESISGQGERRPKRARVSKETDKLDTLVENYTKKLEASDKGKKKKEPVKVLDISIGGEGGLKRWFE